MSTFPSSPKPAAKATGASLFGFRTRLLLTWLALFGLFVAFFLSFDLKFAIIVEKFPNLAGFKLGPNGFLQGAALTLFLCLCSMVVSVLLGFAAALARLSGSAVLVGIASFYTSFFRGTPLLIQILLIYLGLPQVGLVPGAISAGIIALSLNYGAYLSEIFRAGILGVARGQREAALALGMRPPQTFCYIVLPQAMRVIIPPTANQFISMLKDSSLIFGDGGVGSDVPGPVVRALQLPLPGNADYRGNHLLGTVDSAGAVASAPGTALRQGVPALSSAWAQRAHARTVARRRPLVGGATVG